ncbi:general secretion pathway protein GspK [Variovorax sp. WS11]|uniref:type II secretion system minor pseudopilin GspK n=1 Tax=Variovorax sp. WS11 TaxID=1105204 RepID=UPI000D0DEDBF|nr:type II secretion system minor pseudopilin GspK [Variovorax sp. WS11]NDZ15037.1 type II secretion system minor pseudopilin GspK [Variovorax sp. WS11]PSL85559.1 general secretion pathway protein GspK [Variovorax sp. WS11]
MKPPARTASRRSRGAALLTAMLTVTLVATFAAAALWQQWRAVEIEAAERGRVQSSWVLIGALDWSRLILREDARATTAAGGGADHLAEPWAVPLEEAKLSSFLAAEKNIASDALEGLPEAFLQGRIVDAQSKMNVMNLVVNGVPVPAEIAAFTKLFELLGLPAQEVPVLAAQLRRALPPAAATGTGTGTGTTTGTTTTTTTTGTGTTTGAQATTDSSASGPLLPQRTAQLVWLGLSPSTVAALEPYVTILPERMPLNINTASAEAMAASVPSLDLATAKRVVAQRASRYFRTLEDANKVIAQGSGQFNSTQHAVATRFFEVQGRLRLDNAWVEEHSLLQRDNLELRIVWRERGAGATSTAPKS